MHYAQNDNKLGIDRMVRRYFECTANCSHPGKTPSGKRTAELVTLADVLPTLADVLNLEVPELKYPFQGESMADVLLNGGTMNREYVASESWSQGTVITKNLKLGIMLAPIVFHKNWDYRDFGDMLYDMDHDPMEIENQINNPDYQEEINQLRAYYQEYVATVPATGKNEMIQQKQK